MDVSGELHAPAILIHREGTSVFTEYKAGWAPRAVYTLRGTEKFGWSSTLYSADGWHHSPQFRYYLSVPPSPFLRVISGFRRGLTEIFVLLGCYARQVGRFLPTFWYNLTAPA